MRETLTRVAASLKPLPQKRWELFASSLLFVRSRQSSVIVWRLATVASAEVKLVKIGLASAASAGAWVLEGRSRKVAPPTQWLQAALREFFDALVGDEADGF